MIGALSSEAERANTRSSGSNGRGEGIRLLPVLGDYRLSVEMNVEQDRPRGAVCARELCKHCGSVGGIREQRRPESALLECALQKRRVALDVRRLVGNVRQGE
jgi:hypothetical protein